MEKFTVLTGVAAPLMIANINTDAISPVELSRSASVDLGAGLFLHWRYDRDGKEIPDFLLNQTPFRNSKFLIAGTNFGCGSSRERAVWALLKFGFRCIIAPSFAEIFRENAFQNGLLTVELPFDDCEALARTLLKAGEPLVTVDLESLMVQGPDGRRLPFKISAERRMALLEGLEEIAVIVRMEDDIEVFEEADRRNRPWIYLER